MKKEMAQMSLDELDTEMEAMEKVEQAIVTILGLSAGQTVTAEQIELIQFFEDYARKNEEGAVDTFHRGYEAGLARGAGAEAAKLVNERDDARTQASVANALRTFQVRSAFILGARACREMMARFVEQGGDATTAASIRANWRPTWGDDPGALTDAAYENAAPCEISVKPYADSCPPNTPGAPS